MLNYRAFKAWQFDDIEYAYEQKDVILYALGVGFGLDPVDEDQLRFVYEKNLSVVPSMAAIMGYPGPWWRTPELGVNWRKVLHGDQDLQLFAPLPTSGRIIARNRVVAVHDQGPGRYALVQVERDILDASDGTLFARGRRISVLRGDGGFSSETGETDPPPEQLPPIGQGIPADVDVSLSVPPQAALIYRLSGDYNPRHVDPQVARESGFDRPILHGLCTYGLAAHAVLRGLCGYDSSKIRRLAARFSKPVFPGDTLSFEFWAAGEGRFRLRATARDREAVVLDNGIVELRQ